MSLKYTLTSNYPQSKSYQGVNVKRTKILITQQKIIYRIMNN